MERLWMHAGGLPHRLSRALSGCLRFLLESGVAPWMELPLWVPRDRLGMLTVDCSKAFAAGLRIRPLAETVADTLAWAQSRGDIQLRAGLSPARETELLGKWRKA